MDGYGYGLVSVSSKLVRYPGGVALGSGFALMKCLRCGFGIVKRVGPDSSVCIDCYAAISACWRYVSDKKISRKMKIFVDRSQELLLGYTYHYGLL